MSGEVDNAEHLEPKRERKKSTFANPMGEPGDEGPSSIAVAAMIRKTESATPAHTTADVQEPVSQPTTAKTPEHKKETKSKTEKRKLEENLDVRALVCPMKWPHGGIPQPVLYEGRPDVDKPFNMRMKEPLYLSIKAHCEALGKDVSEWARTAMMKLMEEEQQFFLQQELAKKS